MIFNECIDRLYLHSFTQTNYQTMTVSPQTIVTTLSVFGHWFCHCLYKFKSGIVWMTEFGLQTAMAFHRTPEQICLAWDTSVVILQLQNIPAAMSVLHKHVIIREFLVIYNSCIMGLSKPWEITLSLQLNKKTGTQGKSNLQSFKAELEALYMKEAYSILD